MKLKKISWGLSIALILTLTIFLWKWSKNINDNHFEYGKNFNSIRDALNVPVIEDHWITHESSENYRYWSHPGHIVNTTQPIHLDKESIFKGGKILKEIDDFHYETKDSLAFRVVYSYNYVCATWDCKFIRYRKEEFPQTISWKLTLNQADSILNKWGLTR